MQKKYSRKRWDAIQCGPDLRRFLKLKRATENAKDTKYRGPADLILRRGIGWSIRAANCPWPEKRLIGHCYRVSARLAKADHALRYVEGYAHDLNTINIGDPYHIMAHAWAIDDARSIIDKTWHPDCGKAEYAGIVLPTKAVMRITKIFNYYGAFINANNDEWPLVEEILQLEGMEI